MYDLHTHTFLSDGVLSLIELSRRALVRGYRAIGVTNHVGVGNLALVFKALVTDCAEATKRRGILAVPGVEISQVAKDDIGMAAQAAKELGAKVVNVHSETMVGPVARGRNEAVAALPMWNIWPIPGSSN